MRAMLKFLSKILRQKKATILVLLFLVISGLAIPQFSNAGFFDWLFSNNCGDASTARTPEERAKVYECLKGDTAKLQKIDASLGRVEEGIKSLGDVIAIPFAATALAIGMLLITVFASIAALASSILTWIIAATEGAGCYTCMANTVIATGWPMVRDLANMGIVLGFVIIGIATILRFQDYQAKKLLPSLIIVALLINFSLVITGIFIDGSNLMAKHFLATGGFYSTEWTQMLGDQIDVVWSEWNKGSNYTNAGMGVLKSVGGLLFYDIMAIIIFFLYAFLYLFRILALWILVILSPLAFVCWVFPFTKNIWNMWWSNFFQWCIIIVPISFFVWIADTMASEMKNMSQESPMAYLVPGAFMLIGFIFSLKISAMGAGAAIGAFKWSGGKVMGATAWGGKKFADKTGLSRLGAGAKDMATERLERLGLMKPGTTTANQQTRLNDKDRMNRVNSMSAEQMVREITSPRRGQSAHYDRAAMMKKLAENDQLGMVPEAIRANRMAEAVSFGARPKDLIGGLNSGDIANIVNNPAANPLYDEESRAKGVKTLMERNDLDKVAVAERPRVVGEVARHGIRVGDLAKSDYRYREYDRGDNGRAAPVGSANSDGTINANAIGDVVAVKEQLETNWSGMSGQQRRNIDVAHLNREFLMYRTVNADSLKDLRTADDAHRTAFADPLDLHAINPALDADLTTAQTAATAAGNTNEARRIAGVRAEIGRMLNP